MQLLFIAGVLALTSVGGYLYGKALLRLSNRELIAAWRTLLECIWFGLLFLTLNLLVVFTGILALRVATGNFISLYIATDITLPIFSLVQGIFFQLWRRPLGEPDEHPG